MRGAALPEPSWRVGIQHPALRDRVAAVVEANDLALATSGAYARGDHVRRPPHRRRRPPGSPRSPIAGDELATADAYATAAFAMGAAAPAWTATIAPYEALTILGRRHRASRRPGSPRRPA